MLLELLQEFLSFFEEILFPAIFAGAAVRTLGIRFPPPISTASSFDSGSAIEGRKILELLPFLFEVGVGPTVGANVAQFVHVQTMVCIVLVFRGLLPLHNFPGGNGGGRHRNMWNARRYLRLGRGRTRCVSDSPCAPGRSRYSRCRSSGHLGRSAGWCARSLRRRAGGWRRFCSGSAATSQIARELPLYRLSGQSMSQRFADLARKGIREILKAFA